MTVVFLKGKPDILVFTKETGFNFNSISIQKLSQKIELCKYHDLPINVKIKIKLRKGFLLGQGNLLRGIDKFSGAA